MPSDEESAPSSTNNISATYVETSLAHAEHDNPMRSSITRWKLDTFRLVHYIERRTSVQKRLFHE